MSFSKTKVADLEVGDVVIINATKEEMRERNNYRGDFDFGTVTTISEMHHLVPFSPETTPDTRGQMHFKLTDNSESCSWLQANFVTKLEGVAFTELNLEDGDQVMALDESLDITPLHAYNIHFGGWDGEDLGFEDDDEDFRTEPCGLWINLTKVKASFLEPVDPKPVHVKFSELSDEDKGELLLSKHEGKTIQIRFDTGFGEMQWVTQEGVANLWNPEYIHRVAPSEVLTLEADVKEAEARLSEMQTRLGNLNKAA